MCETRLHALQNRRLVGVGLPAAEVAALAWVLERLRNDGRMPDLASVSACAAVEAVIKKKPAPQSDSDEDKQEVVQVAGDAEQVLGHCGGVGIVLDKDREAGVRRKDLTELDIAPL